MNIQNRIESEVKKGFLALYNIEIPTVEFQATRKEFEGDITVVIFPMLRYKKGNPVAIGEDLGNYLVTHLTEITHFNVVKGFLNLVINDAVYIQFFKDIYPNKTYGFTPVKEDEKAMMVEYSSPNTNKPLHLGHVRNNLLGYSVAQIIQATGKKVYKTQIINDRGIHICKSMLAWEKYGNGETPESTGLKGDKLVGNYYVKFDQAYKKEVQKILDEVPKKVEEVLKSSDTYNLLEAFRTASIDQNYQKAIGKSIIEFYKEYAVYTDKELKKELKGSTYLYLDYFFSDNIHLPNFNKVRYTYFEYYLEFEDSEFKKDISILHEHNEYIVKAKFITKRNLSQSAPILLEAQKMLQKWEAGDTEVVALWRKMNGWVYEGFDVTYKNLGVDFDSLYYESNTYLLGKEHIEEGIEKGVFYQKEDGSVWCDLTEDGLDEKLVLRSDGTAVYMTQDIGTAVQRAKDIANLGGLIYTVGNEQDYHFKVLFLILKKLGYSWAEELYHLSYGMVDLPSGKMKSREGTVVDADDLMVEMTQTAKAISEELGKLEGYSNEEKEGLYKTIGLGALKYFILKVDPKKRILFDPKASVDFQGNTGSFIQYTYARIQSILRKANFDYDVISSKVEISLHSKEKELLKQLEMYPDVIAQAAQNYSPAVIANYTYDLVKEFNSFYQNVSILGAQEEAKKIFRVQLAKKVSETIKSAFSLLGIEVPERM